MKFLDYIKFLTSILLAILNREKYQICNYYRRYYRPALLYFHIYIHTYLHICALYSYTVQFYLRLIKTNRKSISYTRKIERIYICTYEHALKDIIIIFITMQYSSQYKWSTNKYTHWRILLRNKSFKTTAHMYIKIKK